MRADGCGSIIERLSVLYVIEIEVNDICAEEKKSRSFGSQLNDILDSNQAPGTEPTGTER